MTEYNEGDLVEAEKVSIASSSRFRGVVYKDDTVAYIKSQCYEPSIDFLIHKGFTVTVLEKAPEPLPTTEGSIVRDGDRLGRVYVLWDGYWCASYGHKLTEEQLRERTTTLVVLYVEAVSS